MKKINLELVFPVLLLVIMIFSLSNQMFMVPPLGKVMDPFLGVIQNENEGKLNSQVATISGTGVLDMVTVLFDKRKVPHIYAKSSADMYFAQGYVTASLRLWQMDFLTYVSSGRLSEIFSKGFVDYDRNQRRKGMLSSAKSSLKLIETDPEAFSALTAYTRGVNAYISQLGYKDFPFEYKILDYAPEHWTNLKSIQLMKYLASLLSGYEEDFMMSKLMLLLGEQRFNTLFPTRSENGFPVLDSNNSQYNLSLDCLSKPEYLNYSFLSSESVMSKSLYNPGVGSNSWVVGKSKTTTGYPILCNDPHMSLSLPAIWLEMQMSSPGINVYGVSIPGLPSIIIGFNEDIAWGITNGGGDAKDWYKLKLTSDYQKYQLDGQWLNTSVTVEEIKRRGQTTLLDTIYHTIHGPVSGDNSFPGAQPELVNHAMKWGLHNPSNEILTYIKLNKAKTYNQFREAIEGYSSPIQNFTFACKNNDIAMHHQGKLPVKWPGQGKFILDGTKSSHLYTNYIPASGLPHVLNPSSDFLVSANQRPTSANYNYYYNGYYNENRVARIKELLSNDNKFDGLKMKFLQGDNVSTFARNALPVLTASVGKASLNTNESNLLRNISSWPAAYDKDNENSELFELWWTKIRDYTWDEFTSYSFKPKTPDDNVLLEMIVKDSLNEYFDLQTTSQTEAAADIVLSGFRAAIVEYNNLKQKEGVLWQNINKVHIVHLTNIPVFSRLDLPSSGHPKAINAVSGNIGPSWKMIVELGERPRAFGIYPGGQSGNVASRYFDNFVTDWNNGQYYPLRFFITMKEAKDEATTIWFIK